MVCLAKVKTTVVLDKRLLEAFKNRSNARRGKARSLSLELEEAIRAYSPSEAITLLASKLGISISRYPSVDEVARNRPKVQGVSAGEIVRRMRDERGNRLSEQ